MQKHHHAAPTPYDADVLIVGAGPAGSTLARLLADLPLRVMLADGQDVGAKKPCGGLLAPDAQKALAGFDLTLPKDVLVGPQIFSVKTIDIRQKLVRYYPRFYLNVDRYRFDRWLLSLVPEQVEVVSARCVSLKRLEEAEGFSALLRFADGSKKAYTCRYVVGADGAGSIVRQMLYQNSNTKDRIKRYVAIQQWFHAPDEPNPFYSCIFDDKTSESCSWSIHKDEFFIFGGSFAAKGCRKAFEKQKKRLEEKCGFTFGEPVKTEVCQVYSPRRLNHFCTGEKGAFLVGEAAGFISPSSLEGISSAILSGKALGEAFHREKDAAAIARRYRRSTWKLRWKLQGKCVKRLFMYVPLLRKPAMKSGLLSIRVTPSGKEPQSRSE